MSRLVGFGVVLPGLMSESCFACFFVGAIRGVLGLSGTPLFFQIVEFSLPKSSISDLKRPVIFGKTTGRNHCSPAIWLSIRRWRLTPLCLFLFETSADCALGS